MIEAHAPLWVEFGDLPDATRKEIRKLMDAGYYDGQIDNIVGEWPEPDEAEGGMSMS
jgi:hypothetical protein